MMTLVLYCKALHASDAQLRYGKNLVSRYKKVTNLIHMGEIWIIFISLFARAASTFPKSAAASLTSRGDVLP